MNKHACKVLPTYCGCLPCLLCLLFACLYVHTVLPTYWGCLLCLRACFLLACIGMTHRIIIIQLFRLIQSWNAEILPAEIQSIIFTPHIGTFDFTGQVFRFSAFLLSYSFYIYSFLFMFLFYVSIFWKKQRF